ncbi:hypothetical protein HOL21_04720 [Candidatus Woesearchaeota archaeon]|jgi:hypothetical protein|nr:hypothetical protein [Candidatus Woesearchaeota archaeon]MBT5397490.1 hypothetical protein [Candidatus Woesearchaeota archaeon]MBT5924611.1 hypothetical protein [Candidatus Woesearchaeota archaeon]MBT6367937.1 hypothetical protein [Candidatus Woesearchaeota archaeon]MBT7763161.1 hypothetical protein [Candidatus Woesearchaeota archaeon]
MVEESIFRGVIDFFGKIGIYDVILPFLLVFTIVFAIFEKTKILGVEKIDGKEYTKKNINSIVAFIVALLVVASTQLVSVINEVMANVVLLLILAVCFLLLVGVFFKDNEFSLEKMPGWTKFFMVVMFIAIIVIFLNALDWFQYIFALFVFWDATWAAAIIFVLVMLGFMWFITKDNVPKSKGDKKE